MISQKHICHFFFGLATSAVCAQSPLSDTRAVVEKWVETRQLTSQLKSDWQVEREVLEQTIEAFEKEKSSIQSQIDATDTSNDQVSKQLDHVEQEKKDLISFSDRLKVEATRMEGRMKALANRLPAGLRDRISPLLDRIPEDASETRISISTRMQNILAVVNEIDKFNGNVNVVSELRKNQSGAEVQVQVLYVGLAQAYFTDPTGAFAGVGTPGDEGWSWDVRTELAPRIQHAIEIYQGSQAAAFVPLPFELK